MKGQVSILILSCALVVGKVLQIYSGVSENDFKTFMHLVRIFFIFGAV